ncbi:MAG: hypothetical protein KF746_03580 [Chitinophagaceae bacterium]|nr:hypothetical protein [Chitinophagaceae bacterium]
MDYFTLRLFDLPPKERALFACTGFMYEYQLKMNPLKDRSVLQDKIAFLIHFKDFSGRKWATIKMLKEDRTLAEELIRNPENKVVIKNATGQAGKQVRVIDTSNLNVEQVVDLMEKNGFNLLEAYVVQHDDLMRLSPAALNTVRIVTQYNDGQAEVLLAFIRVSVNLSIDNLSAGNYGANFGAPIDLKSGKISGPGMYIDVTKADEYYHPVTKVSLVGFQIPLWNESIDLAKKAANHTPQNRSVGWDVAVTNQGPVLIEGNHNWNYLSQLMGNRGLRKEFLQYTSDSLT